MSRQIRGAKWQKQTATVGTETLTFDLEEFGADEDWERRIFSNIEIFALLASPGTGSLAIEIEPKDFPGTWVEIGTYDLAAPLNQFFETQHYTQWRLVPTAASGPWSASGTAKDD